MNHVKSFRIPSVVPTFFAMASTPFFTLLNDDEVSSFCLDKPFVLEPPNCELWEERFCSLKCLDGAYVALEP